MADFATTEEPRSEHEDEPMEDDNDFLADDAPAASTDPCCQAQTDVVLDDLDASKPVPTRVAADCCGGADVEAS